MRKSTSEVEDEEEVSSATRNAAVSVSLEMWGPSCALSRWHSFAALFFLLKTEQEQARRSLLRGVGEKKDKFSQLFSSFDE
jgi:hypothetical protein